MQTRNSQQKRKGLSKAVAEARKKARHEITQKVLDIQLEIKELSHEEKCKQKQIAELICQSTATMPWLTKDMIKSQAKQLKKPNQQQQLCSRCCHHYCNLITIWTIRRTSKRVNKWLKRISCREKWSSTLKITERLKEACAQNNSSRLPVGSYQRMHNSVIQEEGLDNGVTVNKNTVKDLIFLWNKARTSASIKPNWNFHCDVCKAMTSCWATNEALRSSSLC